LNIENCDLPVDDLLSKLQDALADTLPVERGTPIVVAIQECEPWGPLSSGLAKERQ
jgi:hypothetical protein